ncbi:uncharacterized protein LOC120650644 isoform X2 [Panicum virgatum]|uniref:uncharacterized protein LOC120650644 isoform X2 n=1 Tax=Panicum virgatum TaxID=38727 RepID=UPI0019D68750|nr:uncharacterized protein LOC120650644 isoform X2 [Panicum virgatum]
MCLSCFFPFTQSPAPRSPSRRGAPSPADEDNGQHWPFFLLSMRCSAPPRWRRARPLASFSSSPTPPLLARQPPFPLSLPLCLIPSRPARPPLHVSSARSPQLEPNDRRLDAAGRSALLWSISPSSISRAGGQRRVHTHRHVARHGTARVGAPSPHQSCDHCQAFPQSSCHACCICYLKGFILGIASSRQCISLMSCRNLKKLKLIDLQLWISPRSRAADEKKYFDSHVAPFFRIDQVFSTLVTLFVSNKVSAYYKLYLLISCHVEQLFFCDCLNSVLFVQLPYFPSKMNILKRPLCRQLMFLIQLMLATSASDGFAASSIVNDSNMNYYSRSRKARNFA